MSLYLRKLILGAAALALAVSWPGPAPAQPQLPVELELVLAIDTSVSVDSGEYALQMSGLALAFRDRRVLSAIEAVGGNGIAVAVVHWAVGLQQELAVDWTRIHGRVSAEAFARAIETTPRLFTGNGTDITQALAYCAGLFQDNGFRGRRRVIDISGDGRNNASGPPASVRDRTVAAGIVINGLAILDGDLALGSYYAENVTGGAASFVVTAESFFDFPLAMRDKLEREIAAPVAATPSPANPPG